MSMKTRSQSTSSAKGRVDYKKLIEDPDDDELEDTRPATKPRRSPPSPPPAAAAAPPPPATAATPTQTKPESAAPAKPEEQDGDKPVVSSVTDTSKIIDEFLKALRPDAEEPARSNQPARPVQDLGGHDGPASVNHSPTVPNHTYDTLPPPRPRPEITVSRDTKFPCTFARYGCTSTFGSKNEWKRHVAIQHVQLGFYRCDVGVCNPENRDQHSRDSGYNDFNRKDLFTMHQRRMHSPWGVTRQPTPEEKEAFEASLESVRQRCWRSKRQPPLRTTCGFCGRVFEDKIPSFPALTAHAPANAGLAQLSQASVKALQDQQKLQASAGAGPATNAPPKPDDKGDPMDLDQRRPEASAADHQAPIAAQPPGFSEGTNAPPAHTAAQSASTYPPPPHPSQDATTTQTPSTGPPSSYPPLPSPATPSVYPPPQTYAPSPESAQPRPLAPGPPPPQQVQVDAHGQPIVKDPTAWEDRMEHVGRHLAKEDAHLREEAEDPDLTAWGLREGLLKDYGPKGVWLVGHEPQSDSLDGIIRKRKKRIK